jgi:Icc-related predicted phosphoesterase
VIIDCISDLHGFYPDLEGGDLLIVAGDLTAMDTHSEYLKFFKWIASTNYKKRIVIAGNHDNIAQKEEILSLPKHDFDYLCDSGTQFPYFIDGLPEQDEGFLPSGHRTLKIWGSPWTPWFRGVSPKAKAFMMSENEIAKKWELIPQDIDILITHCPPYGIGDQVEDMQTGKIESVGSKSLLKHENWDGGLQFHIFGHIHEGYGEYKEQNGIFTSHCINASHVNKHYEPVNKPIRLILE